MNNKQKHTISMFKICLVLVAMTILPKANGQDWKWLNPNPTGNQLNVVKYLDSTTALAFGNYGTILLSTSEGQNWQQVVSHTNANLLSVSVVNKDTIYVSGQDLSVLKTTDGGHTWTTIREGSYGSRNVSRVFFVNSAVGFLLGDGIEEFFKTTDSGKTWTKLQMSLNFQEVTSLYFTSADTGYASIGSGGTALKTTDGGISWTNISLPLNSFNSVVFTDWQTGFMVGNSGSIIKTEDAGETWQIQNEFPSSLTNNNLTSIDFVSRDIGFIVGGSEILKTTDGGKHWKLIARSEFDLRSVSFSDSLHGLCAGGNGFYEISALIKTSDGGITWDKSSSTITNRYISKIKFFNPDTGYIVGGNTDTFGGFIRKTTDGGNTWQAIDTGSDTYWIIDLALPDETTIFAVGQSGQILKSNDAGTSWQKQTSGTTETLNAVFFVDANTGYVVGDNKTILKTNDGGNTWIKQVSPKTQHLYSVWFKDQNTGYIASFDWDVDSSAVLLTTTDGGLNWQKRSIGIVDYPRKLVFVNQDTAFIAGNFGGILKTTDGGKKWEESFHHGNSYFDMFFTNENTGYVVGENGEISMTENCGKDWTVLDSGTDKDLLSICFTDVNTGFAVGSRGIILKTTNSGSSLKALQQPFYNLCPGDTAVLHPNFIGGTKPLNYTWDQIGTGPSITVAPYNTTTYLVTIKDHELDSIQVRLQVDANSAPTPVISQHGDTLISNVDYGNHWYKNDTLVVDAFTNIFVPKTSGDYYSIVYDYGCYSEKSNVIHVVPTNTATINCDDDIQLYPNPVTTSFNLFFPTDNQHFLTLFDIKGKIIRKQTATGNTVRLNINDLPNGVYFIQILSDDRMTTKKIVKK